MKVSYLGPEGSYTHIAANSVFDKSSDFVQAATISNVMHDLSCGLTDQAIVPVENSISGGVAETIEALQKTENIYINQEFVLSISHKLLVSQSSSINQDNLGQITRVRAHHMALNQCMDFIRNNLQSAEILPSSSNSSAAKELNQKTEANNQEALTHAVIASDLAAQIYKLKILTENINDATTNETRFWTLSKEPGVLEANSKNKTSILFQTKDEPGSLQVILRLFAVNNINLSRIESRPAKKNLGEYLFLVDFDLHRDENKYEELMRQVKQHFTYYKWLGSYKLLN